MQTKQIDLEALPIEVKESRLTDTQKKVLNVFYTYNTLDKTNENGSFFIDNITLKNEAAVSSDTLQRTLSFLITNRFIDRIAGSRTKENGSVASTYVLHIDVINEWCKQNKKTKKNKGFDVKGLMFDNQTNHQTNENNDLVKRIDCLELKVNELTDKCDKMIGLMMGLIQGFDVKGLMMENIKHQTTDTESDTDIEINSKDHKYTGEGNLKVSDTSKIEVRSVESPKSEISEDEIENNNANDTGAMSESKSIITSELKEELRRQAEDWNEVTSEVDNFNYEECEIKTVGNGNNFKFENENQEKYSRLFESTTSLIDEWYRTHDDFTKGKIQSNWQVIQWMFEKGQISQGQYNNSEKCIHQRLQTLIAGQAEYIRNKKTHNKKNFENNAPAPTNANSGNLSRSNNSGEELNAEQKKAQQEANKVAKMAFVESECNRINKQYNLNVVNTIINTVNTYVASADERTNWINKYFDGVINAPSYMKVMRKKALEKVK